MCVENNIERCPLCNYPDIYTGANNIECGYKKECPNWTAKQEEEVDRLVDLRHPIPESFTGPFQFSLDWDKEEDKTPPWPGPSFTTD